MIIKKQVTYITSPADSNHIIYHIILQDNQGNDLSVKKDYDI